MRLLTAFLILPFALMLALATPAAAQTEEALNQRADMLFGEHERLKNAFDAIQQAVTAGDAETLAALVKYPFAVTIDGEDYVLEDEDGFIALYENIITPAVVEAVTSQSYAELFLNSDGAMFGDGEMWLTSVCPEGDCTRSYWVISAVNN